MKGGEGGEWETASASFLSRLRRSLSYFATARQWNRQLRRLTYWKVKLPTILLIKQLLFDALTGSFESCEDDIVWTHEMPFLGIKKKNDKKKRKIHERL